MNRRSCTIFVGLSALALSVLCVLPAVARAQEVKEKSPMYTYIANWQVPRAHWADMQKDFESTRPVLDKALADGTLVGYGDDENVVHQADGFTHDDWWSSNSMAGLMKVLDQISGSGGSASPALQSATKHWDEIEISRYYNWHPGSYKNGYVQVAFYKLKADAPNGAVDMLVKNLVGPLLEKELSDGTITEWEIDEPAVHSEAPGTFAIVWVCPNADGIDKMDASIRGAIKAQPLGGPAFGSMTDFTGHRDELNRGNGTFK